MVSVQVIGVCVWRLVTMMRRGTVFSQAVARDVEAAQMQAELDQMI